MRKHCARAAERLNSAFQQNCGQSNGPQWNMKGEALGYLVMLSTPLVVVTV
jgi:hypothetical protein